MARLRSGGACFRGSQLVPALLLVLAVVDPASGEELPQDRVLFLASADRYSVVQGERFSIDVFLDETVPEDVEVHLPELPPGLEIDDMPVLVTRSDTTVEARIEGVARRPGRFIVNPIRIDTTSGPWFIPRLLVEVAPARGAPVPFGARWRLLREPVFQGQSVPVVLEITGIDSFTYPDSISVRTPPTGLFEEVSGIGSVLSDLVAGVELFQIPVAVFLFTPTSAGDVLIPSAEVEALGISATAPQLNLDVLPLPSMIQRTGSVGRFSMDASMSTLLLEPGESAELRVRVDGAGNFPVLDLPEISLDGLRILDQTESGEFSPDSETFLGYRGYRVQTIRLEPDGESSTGTVVVEGFSYIDPVTARVISMAPRVFEVEIPGEAGVTDAGRETPDFPLLSLDELRLLRWHRIADVRWPLFFFLAGPAIFAIVRLLSVQRRGGVVNIAILAGIVLFPAATIIPELNSFRLARAGELAGNGEYAVAGVLYDLELQEHGSHAGLHFNRGILAIRSENTFAAVYHLRRAARLAPEESTFRRAYTAYLEYAQPPDQIGLPVAVRPDIPILVLLVLWSAIWFVLLARSAVLRSIVLVSLVMATIIAGATLVWSLHVASQYEGIVRHEVTVRRIPDSSAEPWVQLNPVTTLNIELSYDDFFLVRTSSGVTGWVPQRDILELGAFR